MLYMLYIPVVVVPGGVPDVVVPVPLVVAEETDTHNLTRSYRSQIIGLVFSNQNTT